MTALSLTFELFFRVDEALPQVQAHPLSKLHPSEAVTLGLLYALKGGSFRSFYRWVQNELCSLFPRLPERTRLGRILNACSELTSRFLAQPSFFGALDSYGLTMLHPRRARRPSSRFARFGKSNSVWIAGAKVCLCINDLGQVVCFEVAPANVSDLHFLPLAHALDGHSILLADKGFLLSHKPKKAYLHKKKGRTRPGNVLICERGQWNERRLIETVFALFTQVLRLKHLTQRTHTGVTTRLAFAIALFNILSYWDGHVNLQIARFSL